jgi:hypothetical protein
VLFRSWVRKSVLPEELLTFSGDVKSIYARASIADEIIADSVLLAILLITIIIGPILFRPFERE